MANNILDPESPLHRQILRDQIDAWSDQIQKHASDLAEQHRDLLPKSIGNAQLSGLSNIVASERYFEQVKKFTRHQGAKAEKKADRDVQAYWKAVGEALEQLANQVEEVIHVTGLALPPKENRPKEMKTFLNEQHLLLAREWVQHFVAQSLLLSRPR